MTGSRQLTVRFFAAARAAAGAESDLIPLDDRTTVADVVRELSFRNKELALVLARCSYLCDGIAIRDHDTALRPGQTLDVLPPFAGG